MDPIDYKSRARRMTDAALLYSAADAKKAADAAAELDRAGCRTLKTEGNYLDEAYAYLDELRRRRAGGKL